MLSPERAAFIDAILDNPADDTVRLVFADWLEEHGESKRAEFIRAQIEAAKLPEAKRAKSKPGKRADVLLKSHWAAWRAALGLSEHEWHDAIYARGFHDLVLLELEVFPERAAALLAREPVGIQLDLLPTTLDMAAFTQNAHLRAVTTLGLHGGFGEKRFARLMKSPHLRNLRVIEISDYVGAAGVRAIANAPAAFTLEHLNLNGALDDDDSNDTAIKLLAKSPRFASLKRLDLMFNRLTNKHVRTLLASKVLPRTLHLDIGENEYDEERFEEELAERFTGGSDKEEE